MSCSYTYLNVQFVVYKRLDFGTEKLSSIGRTNEGHNNSEDRVVQMGYRSDSKSYLLIAIKKIIIAYSLKTLYALRKAMKLQ